MSLIVTDNTDDRVIGVVYSKTPCRVYDTSEGYSYLIDGSELKKSLRHGIRYNNVYKSGKELYAGHIFASESIIDFGSKDMFFCLRGGILYAYSGGRLYRIPVSAGYFANGFSTTKLGVTFYGVTMLSNERLCMYGVDALFFKYYSMPPVLKVDVDDRTFWYEGVPCDKCTAERMLMGV